jgi:hypothetical protein
MNRAAGRYVSWHLLTLRDIDHIGCQAVVPLRDGPPQATARGQGGAQVWQLYEVAARLTARTTRSTIPYVPDRSTPGSCEPENGRLAGVHGFAV